MRNSADTTDRSWRHRRWRLLAGAIAIAVVVAAPAAALASVAAEEIELGGTLRSGDEVTVPADETFDGNLYVFAGQVTIDGTVDGDVLAGAGQIDVNGTVTGDLLVFGGQVTVSGDVGGDIRFAGGQLTAPGDIGGDVAMVGGAGDIDGTVGSDLLFGVGQMTLTGDVDGDVYGAGGEYNRPGTVGGEENVTLPIPDEEPSTGDRIVDGLLRAVSIFVVGALGLLLFPRRIDRVVGRVQSEPLRCLLFGLVALAALVAGVIAAVILGVVVSILFAFIGLDLLIGTYWFAFVAAIIALALLVFAVWVLGAPIVTALTGTDLVAGRDTGIWIRLAGLAVGLLVYQALTALPVVGGILAFMAFLLALGAIVLGVRYVNSLGRRQESEIGVRPEHQEGAETGAG